MQDKSKIFYNVKITKIDRLNAKKRLFKIIEQQEDAYCFL